MRTSVIVSVVLHVLTGTAALLWLIVYFIPAGALTKWLAALLVILLACWLLWQGCRRRKAQSNGRIAPFELPLLPSQGPIVLTCGDGLDDLFQQQVMRITAQGCWLRVPDIGTLSDMVRCIQLRQPRQVGQLAVMYVCLPDRHQDEAVLRASLKILRQQLSQLGAQTGFTLPVVLSCAFSGPETPWLMVSGSQTLVCSANESPLLLADWQQAESNFTSLPLLSQGYAFIRATLLEELEKADRLYPAVHPFAVLLCSGSTAGDHPSLWSVWLYHRTCLHTDPLLSPKKPTCGFPDAVLPLLSPFLTPVQGGQYTQRLVLLLCVCVLAAVGFSASNNRHLIRQIAVDLQRWHAIPMDHYLPKSQSLAVLKQHALLLERWQRQGEPVNFSLGYYSGQRLWLVLQQAIDTYIPQPAPPPAPLEKPATKRVRLDSLSLFDSGKAVLKPGSSKVLVNALVGIKARPGWLIVVSGHTDNTGGALLNQKLSLQRAQAVRNWMQETGDMAASCFAVQGFGDSRPMASNATAEGRARNRRVEISLLPQPDVCREADITTPLATERDSTES